MQTYLIEFFCHLYTTYCFGLMFYLINQHETDQSNSRVHKNKQSGQGARNNNVLFVYWLTFRLIAYKQLIDRRLIVHWLMGRKYNKKSWYNLIIEIRQIDFYNSPPYLIRENDLSKFPSLNFSCLQV